MLHLWISRREKAGGGGVCEGVCLSLCVPQRLCVCVCACARAHMGCTRDARVCWQGTAETGGHSWEGRGGHVQRRWCASSVTNEKPGKEVSGLC